MSGEQAEERTAREHMTKQTDSSRSIDSGVSGNAQMSAREIRKPLKNPIPAHRSEEIRRGSPITAAERAAYDEYREAMTRLRQKAGRAGARKRWNR